MSRIVPKYRKRFKEFYNVPKRCDICGEFQDPAGDDEEYKFMLRCSNRHIFCSHHLQLFINTDMTDIREYCRENFPDWYPGKEKLTDAEIFLQCRIKLKASNEDLLKKERAGEKIFDREGPRSNKMNSKEKVATVLCPICMFRAVNETEILNYLLDKWKIDKNAVIKEIQDSFHKKSTGGINS